MITRTHTLKVWPVFWDVLESGTKNFEVRLNDRQFQAGDYIQFMRTHPERLNEVDLTFHECHNAINRRITFVLAGGQFGIDDEYCVLALEPVTPSELP